MGRKQAALQRRLKLKQMLKDARINGRIFVKSESVAMELKVIDPDIQIRWIKEDKSYEVTYAKRGAATL